MSRNIAFLCVPTFDQDLEKNKAEILHLANDRNLGKVEFIQEKVSGKISWKKQTITPLLDELVRAIKTNKLSFEPLETAHRTISMSQLGLISVQTGTSLKWNLETAEIIGDNMATALLNIEIREKYFKF
jgi:hypothetical protein